MRTILVDPDVQFLDNLEQVLVASFPIVQIVAKYSHRIEALPEILRQTPDILFFNIDNSLESHEGQHEFTSFPHETIYTASSYEYASTAISQGASGYIVKPLKECEVVAALRYCIHHRLQSQLIDQQASKELKRDREQQLICIPTIEGADFLFPKEIIRCEGLQKCTRIVSTERSDIISSYHIGVFRELLDGLGFVQPHKSHLVNMKHIRKYLREGTLYMSDGSTVPVSRRRKCDLFNGLKSPQRLPFIPE